MAYGVQFKAFKMDPKIIDVAGATMDAILFIDNFMESMIADIKTYPPVPAGSTYQRTGDLAASWDFIPARVTASGIVGTITNNATDRASGRRYMRYVQGSWQTAQHRATGWKRIDEFKANLRTEFKFGMQAVFNANMRTAIGTVSFGVGNFTPRIATSSLAPAVPSIRSRSLRTGRITPRRRS